MLVMIMFRALDKFQTTPLYGYILQLFFPLRTQIKFLVHLPFEVWSKCPEYLSHSSITTFTYPTAESGGRFTKSISAFVWEAKCFNTINEIKSVNMATSSVHTALPKRRATSRKIFGETNCNPHLKSEYVHHFLLSRNLTFRKLP